MKAQFFSMKRVSWWFIWSVGLVLTFTGIAKIYSAVGNGRSEILTYNDPLFGLPFGFLMLTVGFTEIAIATACFFFSLNLASGLIAWMSTSFAFYRIGLWAVNWQRPCGCLGNVTDAIGMSHATADKIMLTLLAYMLIGSYAILIQSIFMGRKKLNDEMKATIGAKEVF